MHPCCQCMQCRVSKVSKNTFHGYTVKINKFLFISILFCNKQCKWTSMHNITKFLTHIFFLVSTLDIPKMFRLVTWSHIIVFILHIKYLYLSSIKSNYLTIDCWRKHICWWIWQLVPFCPILTSRRPREILGNKTFLDFSPFRLFVVSSTHFPKSCM